MKALRLLLGSLVFALALAPIAFHWTIAGPYLAKNVGIGAVAIHLSGCVTWTAVCWLAWPAKKREQP